MVKAIEFDSTVTNGAQIELPSEVRQQVPQGSNVRVILVLDPDDVDDLGPLREMATERFAAAFCADDQAYDDVPDDAQSR